MDLDWRKLRKILLKIGTVIVIILSAALPAAMSGCVGGGGVEGKYVDTVNNLRSIEFRGGGYILAECAPQRYGGGCKSIEGEWKQRGDEIILFAGGYQHQWKKFKKSAAGDALIEGEGTYAHRWTRQ